MPGVDIEPLVINAMLDDAAIIAIVGDRVYRDLPPNPRPPLLLVSRVGGLTDFLGHLDGAILQFEAWARDRDTAHDLAAAVLSAALALRGTYTEGVVTGAFPFTGLGYLPDPPTSTPRYIFRLQLYCHPLPVSV